MFSRKLFQHPRANETGRQPSAHGHIHSKIRNKLAPETTKKLVYVYSNRKLVSKIEDTDELKMFAWEKLNEDVEARIARTVARPMQLTLH